MNISKNEKHEDIIVRLGDGDEFLGYETYLRKWLAMTDKELLDRHTLLMSKLSVLPSSNVGIKRSLMEVLKRLEILMEIRNI